jgi:hypothetical protein
VAQLEPHKLVGKGAATALPPVPVLVGADQLRSFRSRGPRQPRRTVTQAPQHNGVSLDSRAAGRPKPVSGNEA